jgi:hypothetical protein
MLSPLGDARAGIRNVKASDGAREQAPGRFCHGPTGRQRGRIYAYSDYLALLDRGTDPLPA